MDGFAQNVANSMSMNAMISDYERQRLAQQGGWNPYGGFSKVAPAPAAQIISMPSEAPAAAAPTFNISMPEQAPQEAPSLPQMSAGPTPPSSVLDSSYQQQFAIQPLQDPYYSMLH